MTSSGASANRGDGGDGGVTLQTGAKRVRAIEPRGRYRPLSDNKEEVLCVPTKEFSGIMGGGDARPASKWRPWWGRLVA